MKISKNVFGEDMENDKVDRFLEHSVESSSDQSLCDYVAYGRLRALRLAYFTLQQTLDAKHQAYIPLKSGI